MVQICCSITHQLLIFAMLTKNFAQAAATIICFALCGAMMAF